MSHPMLVGVAAIVLVQAADAAETVWLSSLDISKDVPTM